MRQSHGQTLEVSGSPGSVLILHVAGQTGRDSPSACGQSVRRVLQPGTELVHWQVSVGYMASHGDGHLGQTGHFKLVGAESAITSPGIGRTFSVMASVIDGG